MADPSAREATAAEVPTVVTRRRRGAAAAGAAAAAAVGVPRSSRSLRSKSSSQRSSMPCVSSPSVTCMRTPRRHLDELDRAALDLAVVAALEGDEGGVGVLVDHLAAAIDAHEAQRRREGLAERVRQIALRARVRGHVPR